MQKKENNSCKYPFVNPYQLAFPNSPHKEFFWGYWEFLLDNPKLLKTGAFETYTYLYLRDYIGEDKIKESFDRLRETKQQTQELTEKHTGLKSTEQDISLFETKVFEDFVSSVTESREGYFNFILMLDRPVGSFSDSIYKLYYTNPSDKEKKELSDKLSKKLPIYIPTNFTPKTKKAIAGRIGKERGMTAIRIKNIKAKSFDTDDKFLEKIDKQEWGKYKKQWQIYNDIRFNNQIDILPSDLETIECSFLDASEKSKKQRRNFIRLHKTQAGGGMIPIWSSDEEMYSIVDGSKKKYTTTDTYSVPAHIIDPSDKNKRGLLSTKAENFRKVRAILIDLDPTTSCNFKNFRADDVARFCAGIILHEAEKLHLPLPSSLVFSGRGLQLHYSMKEPFTPHSALGRVKKEAMKSENSPKLKELNSNGRFIKEMADNTQKVILESFEVVLDKSVESVRSLLDDTNKEDKYFGSIEEDFLSVCLGYLTTLKTDNAPGTSRQLFRFPGTVNTKTYEYARTFYSNADNSFKLSELLRIFRAFLYDPNESHAKKQTPVVSNSRRGGLKNYSQEDRRRMNIGRIKEISLLQALRVYNGQREGKRYFSVLAIGMQVYLLSLSEGWDDKETLDFFKKSLDYFDNISDSHFFIDHPTRTVEELWHDVIEYVVEYELSYNTQFKGFSAKTLRKYLQVSNDEAKVLSQFTNFITKDVKKELKREKKKNKKVKLYAKIQKLHKHGSWSFNALAKKFGLSHPTVSKIVNGDIEYIALSKENSKKEKDLKQKVDGLLNKLKAIFNKTKQHVTDLVSFTKASFSKYESCFASSLFPVLSGDCLVLKPPD